MVGMNYEHIRKKEIVQRLKRLLETSLSPYELSRIYDQNLSTI